MQIVICSRRARHASMLLLSMAICAGSGALAQWSGSPGKNTTVCAASGDQTVPSIVSDGSGGAIVAWNDTRSVSSAIYMQRLSSLGMAMWTKDGISVRTQHEAQESVQLVSDGRGGAIAIWMDFRAGDTVLYSQRLNLNGAAMWNADGVPIVSVGGSASFQAVSDNASGFIVIWEDRRSGNPDIYGQRIGSDGRILWGEGGIAVCGDSGSQSGPVITPDGVGGALCTWTDSRPAGIYAQRLNDSGIPQWGLNGLAVITPASGRSVSTPAIASDGAGGAVVTYFSRSGSGSRLIMAQRLDASGMTRWTDTLDQEAEMSQGNLRTVSSGSVVTTLTVYAHGGVFHYGVVSCVDTAGTVLWRQGPFADESDILAIVGDNEHGVFVLGSVTLIGEPFRFSVQHISGTGSIRWVSGGVYIDTTSASSWPANPVMVIDGAGGLIASWQQNRVGTVDIFAQHIDLNGGLPVLPAALASSSPAYSLSQNFPNPFNPSTTIRFALPEREDVTLIVYNTLGQRVRMLVSAVQDPGPHEVQFDASVVASGMYYYTLQAGSFVQTKKLLVLH